MRQSQLFSKVNKQAADRMRRLVAGKTNATKNAFSCAKILSNCSMAAKVVSSSAPGPPQVPELVYSATDKHSASYAVKCLRGLHKISASLDPFCLQVALYLSVAE